MVAATSITGAGGRLRRTRSLLSGVDRLLYISAGALTAVYTLCVIAQVAARYIFAYPLPWTEELSRYSFIWACFLAAAPVVANNGHFAIDIIIESVDLKSKRALMLVVDLISLSFAIILAYYGWKWASRMTGFTTPILEISQGVVYSIVPLSAAYMSVHFVVRLIRLTDLSDTAVLATSSGETDPC